ncbi:hypothetical protein [Paenibacillus sp. JDR-2]|uniref:hypothetical protein n=1 Tax=Paenibacillus sp. (strain JDR-2) TaxID=324057 RepID=UPI0001663F30|nr:hypothetical protein [Paenibacillus sp. JDR-2]ACT02924.1 hypothetical protein Pjdr2_4302 [Paenibacillus sp. JDR-2]
MFNSEEVQNSLYIEAQNVVNELGIMSFLVTFGETEIVGSVAYRLIVKKDIDIHLLTKHDQKEVARLTYNF